MNFWISHDLGTHCPVFFRCSPLPAWIKGGCCTFSSKCKEFNLKTVRPATRPLSSASSSIHDSNDKLSLISTQVESDVLEDRSILNMQGSGPPGSLCTMVSLNVHLYYRRSRGFQQGQEGHRGSCKKKNSFHFAKRKCRTVVGY